MKRSFRRTILLFLLLAYYTLIGGTVLGRSLWLVVCSQLLLVLVLLVWTLPKLLKGMSIPQSPIDLPVMIFLLTVIVSCALSSDGRLSLETTLRLVSLALLFYFLLDMLLQDWSSGDLATAILMTGGVVTIVGLCELLQWHGALGNDLGDVRGWGTTFLSLSVHAERMTLGLTNHLEMFFVLVIPLAISRLVTTPSRWTKLALLAWFGGTGILLHSTFSRGWHWGVGASLITLSLTMIWPRLAEPPRSLRRLERTTWAQIALLTTSSSILILATYATAAWLLRTRLPIDPGRINLWASAFRIIRGFPLLGTGPGTFGWALHVEGDPAGVFGHRFPDQAHSLFMNVAAETGLIGLVALLALMATATLACVRLWIKESQRSHDRIEGSDPFTVWPMVAGLTGLVAWSLFDLPAVAPFSGVYAIAYLAVAMQPLSRPARRCSRWFAVPLFLCVVGIALLLIPIDTAHYYQSKALESVEEGNLVDAVVLLDKAAALDPKFGVYPFQRGIAFGLLALQTGDAEKMQAAISDYETTILRGDDFAENNLQLGWLAWRAGRSTEALARLRRAAQLAPYNSRYHLGLGYVLEELGDVESAADSYARAIALSPGLIRSGFWQTTAFRRQLKPDLITKAVALLPTLQPWDADDDDDQLWMATLAYYGDDLSSATRFLNVSKPSPSYYLLQGKIAEQQGNWGLARTHFDKALQIKPNFGAAYLQRGRLYARLGSLQRAQHDLHVAAALRVADAGVALGLLAYQSGDIPQAISKLQAGLRPPCPSLLPGYLYATHVWHRTSLEVDFAPDIIRCAPRDDLIPAYLYLAEAYGRTNQPNKAAEICQWLGSYYEPSYIHQWAPGELGGSPCEEVGDSMPNY